ncbi:hypothetical protein EV183_003338 [Coemansia sp. RSA 2336]|nr:hypothetical protein EV183_003338 [Coemansia sp. RSA 2336]
MSIVLFDDWFNAAMRSLDSASTPSNSTAAQQQQPPPENLHGVLGHWAVVGYGINICSIVVSSLVILVTAVVLWKNFNLLRRPSLRLTAPIAVCDIIYSVCQMFVFNNSYMSQLPEIRLRTILWIMSGSTVSFILLSSCIGIQLVLSVATRNRRICDIIEPWYEVGSFFIGYLITHPYMYVFKHVKWIPTAQVFYLEDEIQVSRRNLWVIHWMWIFVGIVFLFLAALLTFLQMHRIWSDRNSVQRSPELVETKDGPKRKTYTKAERKRIFSVTLRVLMYPMIPVITQIMVVICNFLARPPFWLYVMANIMPTFQGILNFIAFALNPAFDKPRSSFVSFIMRRGSNRPPQQDFKAIEETDSTRHLQETLRGPESVYSMSNEKHIIA